MSQPIYQPDFEAECRNCGTSPCVLVLGHPQPDTELCGRCFFDDEAMVIWELWNDDSPNQGD